MNKMLNQLRIDGDGKEKGIEDFDDLDDEDSDDEGTGWNLVKSHASQKYIELPSSHLSDPNPSDRHSWLAILFFDMR